MAPLGMNSDRNFWTTNPEIIAYAAAFGVCTTLILLVIVCACSKKKADEEKLKEEMKMQADAAPEAGEEAAPMSEKAKSQKSTSGSKRGAASGASPKSGITPPSGTESKMAGTPDVKKSLQLKKVATPAVKSFRMKFPTPGEQPSGPPSIPKSAPQRVKSFRAAPSPAPPPSSVPQSQGSAPAQGDFLKSARPVDVKSVMPTIITPKEGAKVSPMIMQKPDMEHVQHDDPAYRSLVGLDDAFHATQRTAVGSQYGAGSVMPSVQSVTHQPSQISAMEENEDPVSADTTKKKGGKGKKEKDKPKKKKSPPKKKQKKAK